jgi:hypothetical protein
MNKTKTKETTPARKKRTTNKQKKPKVNKKVSNKNTAHLCLKISKIGVTYPNMANMIKSKYLKFPNQCK